MEKNNEPAIISPQGYVIGLLPTNTNPFWDGETPQPGKGGLPEGGLEGQVLTKASDEDFDAVWKYPEGGEGDVSEIKRDVETLKGNVSELQETTEDNSENIEANTAAINALSGDITSVVNDVEQLQLDVVSVGTRVSTVESNLVAAEGRITANEAEIIDTNAHVEAVEEEVEELSDWLSDTVRETIPDMKADIRSAESTANNALSKATEANTNVAQLDSRVNSWRVSTEAEISAINAKLVEKETLVSFENRRFGTYSPGTANNTWTTVGYDSYVTGIDFTSVGEYLSAGDEHLFFEGDLFWEDSSRQENVTPCHFVCPITPTSDGNGILNSSVSLPVPSSGYPVSQLRLCAMTQGLIDVTGGQITGFKFVLLTAYSGANLPSNWATGGRVYMYNGKIVRR